MIFMPVEHAGAIGTISPNTPAYVLIPRRFIQLVINTLPNPPRSDNPIRSDESTCLDLPKLLIEILLVHQEFIMLPGEYDGHS